MRIVLSTAGYRRNEIAAGSVVCRDHSPPGPRDTHCICILAHLGGEIALALAVASIHSESSLEPLLWTSIFRRRQHSFRVVTRTAIMDFNIPPSTAFIPSRHSNRYYGLLYSASFFYIYQN